MNLIHLNYLKKKFANKYHFPSLKQKIFKFDSLFLNLLSNFYYKKFLKKCWQMAKFS